MVVSSPDFDIVHTNLSCVWGKPIEILRIFVTVEKKNKKKDMKHRNIPFISREQLLHAITQNIDIWVRCGFEAIIPKDPRIIPDTSRSSIINLFATIF